MSVFEILSLLYNLRLLTKEQIQKHVSPDCSIQYINRLMSELVTKKYISRIKVNKDNSLYRITKTVFKIESKGINYLKTHNGRILGNDDNEKCLIDEYKIEIPYCESKYEGIDVWSNREDVDLFYQIEQSYKRPDYYKKFSRYNVCTPHKIDYDELEKEVLKDIRKKCRSYLKTSNFEELLKNNDKMTKIQIDLEKQLTKIKNDISQQTIYIDRLYKDKLKGLIDEEMFKRQYNNLTHDTINLRKKSNEIETKLFSLKNKVANKDNMRYTSIIQEYLSLKKPSKKLLSSLIDKITIDEEQNVNICYKIKPLY